MAINKQSSGIYDLSLSDLFSSVLFVFILLLAYFILQFQDKTKKLSEPLTQRGLLLKELKEDLKKRGVVVHIDESDGILRIADFDKCIYFKRSSHKLTSCGRKNFKKIKGALKEILPCYASKEFFLENCKNKKLKEKKLYGFLDTILIEGHTDRTRVVRNQRTKGRASQKYFLENNLHLSAERAREAYTYLSQYKETGSITDKGNLLVGLKNGRGKRILGISGFGRFREIYEDRDKNRRIDIRFIMKTPEDVSKKVEEYMRAYEGE